MTRRSISLVVVIFSILVMPYWFYIPILFISIVLVPFFWEGMFAAFLMNSIHGGGTEVLPLLVSPLTLFPLIILIIMLPIRENLRSHA